jgi:hypothetical protein
MRADGVAIGGEIAEMSGRQKAEIAVLAMLSEATTDLTDTTDSFFPSLSHLKSARSVACFILVGNGAGFEVGNS